MRKLLPVFILFLMSTCLLGQTPGGVIEGSISYVTSQNVYVKFETTENISVGDTLFSTDNSVTIPVLVVQQLSSISCVCSPVSRKQLSVGDKISARNKSMQPEKGEGVAIVPPVQDATPVNAIKDSVSVTQKEPEKSKQSIRGRMSVSSYSNFSNVSDFSQRMRYTISLNAQNISNSKVSAEAYISFVHKYKEWSEVKEDIFNGLKMYSLSANYTINKNNTIWIGRKINTKLSNVGAIDGLQYETKFKSVTAGIFAGTRPDYMNYSFNAELLQYGGYAGHDYANKKGGSVQTSVAFVEQKNKGNTDRRFAYLQHSNSLLPKLNFFGSVEFDLFNKVLNTQDSTYTQDNTPNLSNLYVSLRYKVVKQLSLSLSYSNRQNIVYYETYKNIIDQLLEESTMQGYMFQVNYHPGKKLTVGANAGYRFGKLDPRPSKNLYSYITYSSVPWINASATVSATFLETSYLNGSIYSLGLSRDLIPGKLYGGVGYRYVNYKFVSAETQLKQNMAEVNLTWRMMKKLSCSLNYEGTFEKGRNYERIYVNLTQRF